uniref:Uncharacterized protein n=1 Tax=Anguilla anguilla TaxID=7936 RepID=A0A0E9Y2B7_ANGAN
MAVSSLCTTATLLASGDVSSITALISVPAAT